MEQNISVAMNSTASIILPSSVTSTNIIEEGPRVCPLCSSEIRYFFVNLNEKMLMCENMECEFPFGYENLQFIKLDNEEDMSDVVSVQTKPSRASPMPTSSVVSNAAWSEIDKMNKIYESEDSQLDHRSFEMQNIKDKIKKKTKINRIKKNVEEIKSLNMELMEESDSKPIIQNEKWIKNLMKLQQKSGLQLVKPEEMRQLKNDDKSLKIDIETSGSSGSSIRIQIAD